ncbi:NADPH-dependent methylglyoxal reductase Gre2p [Monosporozyma unispora]|nr:methylglyoxal reductase (NADPH-dependent) gre2 [Kazachstania unispora]
MSVFVSGATGFIAQHIVGQLLEQNYKVIGTARSTVKADKLKSQFGNNPNLTIEIVEDISKPKAFDAAIKKHAKDIKYVLHTASPFHFDTEDIVKDLFNPAIEGTKDILESIKRHAADTVERVVITSSYAAIMDFDREADDTYKVTESTWNPDTWKTGQANAVRGYCASKKFAEEAAWAFLKENRDVVKFKLSVVNPVYVFGPQQFDSDVSAKLNTSCEIVNSLIHSSPESSFDPAGMYGGYIDVRDVAKAHLLAFQKEETIGQRLILHGGKFSSQDIADVLNEDFPQLKGKIPVGKPHTGVLGVGEKGVTVDNSKTKQILGFKFISFRQTIHDTAAQILKHEGKL